MKHISVKYNPYLVISEILVEGEKPKPNSSLNFSTIRLQEWVGKLPEIISKEYNDRNIDCLEFIGTTADFEDLKISFDSQKDNCVSVVKFKHKKTADISDVEKTVDEIFTEIQQGPVGDLKHPSIIESFEKAKSQEFEVNVVGGVMPSGKTTLINALLGVEILPSRQSCTTTIVRITDVDQKNYSATSYDSDGKIVDQINDVTLKEMQRMNDDENIYMIDIKCKIPFASPVGMKLVIVNNPTLYNSHDEHHKETVYKMLANSDKSLVLYVMNATALGINDDNLFLNYVCESMNSGGKQSRDRYIFAVNRIDSVNPKHDGGVDCIERLLKGIKIYIEDRKIFSPNIFPVAALPALELRTEEEECETLPQFKMKSKRYPCMHFENYYHFSNLPDTIKAKFDKLLSECNEDQKTEIHTGIVSIEMAISQYVNKYARTTKIYDLVHSFNTKLDEVAVIANIEEAIREDETKKGIIQNQIRIIKQNIEDAYTAKTVSNQVEKLDFELDMEVELSKIDKSRVRELEELSSKIDAFNNINENIRYKRATLEWTRNIQKRINDIINF